jgi:hypothetical protein
MRKRLPRLGRVTDRYPHVVASLALFIALGGPSYASDTVKGVAGSAPAASAAATKHLARNTVGTAQLRPGAVHLTDIATTTRRSLRGATGPQGAPGAPGAPGASAIAYFATVSGAGEIVKGNAAGGQHTTNGSGSYTITFPRSVSPCTPVATLGGIDATVQPPGIITTSDNAGSIGVQITDLAGNPVDRSFNLEVAC